MVPQKEAQKPLVLVVDDEEMMRLMARESLEPAGFRVEEAESGDEALDRFHDVKPEIVLMDVKMPGMDGFEVCRKIRDLPEGQSTPILMMTGLNDPQSIQISYSAGATDFVNKPVNWVVLGHRLEYMLRATRSASALQKTTQKLSSAQRIARMGYWEWHLPTGKVSLSRELAGMLGRPAEAATIPVDEFLQSIHPHDQRAVNLSLERLVREGRSESLEYRIQGRRELWVRQEIETIHVDGPRLERITAALQDITERKTAEREAHYLSVYDGLTGLPNRVAYERQLTRVLEKAGRRRQGRTAVLFLDLDRFQRINESLGHSTGDELLRAVAQRLEASVRKSDTVGRLRGANCELVSRFGGDEFVMLLPSVASPEVAETIARRVLANLAEPFELDGRQVPLTASAGLAIAPYDGEDTAALLRHAEAALYRAKRGEGGRMERFVPSMSNNSLERLDLESDLGRALERHELELFYQPQLDVASGRIVAAEALLRWRHPELGILSPAKFLDVAEEAGLIHEIGDWTLRAACHEALKRQRRHLEPVPIAVNLSGRQFEVSDFAERVTAILHQTGCDPRSIELELTEHTLMHDIDSAARTLAQLKTLGLRLAIDDFGTGYSSLSYLMRFPLDTLKIDRSFLAEVPEDAEQTTLFRAILAMAKSLGLRVVAEGVERPEQAAFLEEEGCDLLQGHLISEPLTSQELAKLLARSNDGDRRGPRLVN